MRDLGDQVITPLAEGVEKNKKAIKEIAETVRDLGDQVITPLAEDVEKHGKDIDALKEQHSAHETSITNLDNRTTALEAVKGTKEGLETLKKVEAKVDKNTGDIKTVATGLVKTAEKIDEINDKNAEQDNEISGNAEAIDANTKAIDKNTEEIDNAKKLLVSHDENINKMAEELDDIGNLAQSNADGVKANEETIAELDEDLTTLEGRVDANEDTLDKHGEAITKLVKGLGEAAEELNKDIVELDTKAVNAQKAADAADGKAVKAQETANAAKEAAKAAAQAATDKSAKAKEEAITTAGTQADAKLNEAKAALDKKLGNLDSSTVKLDKYGQDIAALQEKDKNHEARLTTVENDVKTVGANAAALAALKPLQYNPGQTTQVMAGVGTYRGKTAVALGAAHYASENLMYHAGVSFGNGNGTMANAGVTIGFGSGEGAKMSSSKVAELQSAVDRLTAENEQVKAALYDIYAKLQAK